MCPSTPDIQPPRLIAWEITRRCPLNCKHCRAAARDQVYPDELTTDQCLRLLDNIASFAKPIIILTGGEPMSRSDIYTVARHGHNLGLRVVMAPCGTLINQTTIQQIIEAGIQCISISLDGATAASHDAFRGIPGAFDSALNAIRLAQSHNLPFQINTTITQHNLDELPAILNLATELKAVTFNPFLLVPIGRGSDLAHQALSPEQYEQTLQYLAQQSTTAAIPIRVTCAPHYQRIIRQNKSFAIPDAAHPQTPTKFQTGCMGGKTFAFISHTGSVQICGFLEQSAGQLTQNNLDFQAIWHNSDFLRSIRAVDEYQGKCGFCEYRYVCGGCRARAFALTGDYLQSEPFCVYQPQAKP
ncbi:MAG: radical SAM protein [Sedimentisphaerales bacterium]|nr:radical SAM protein [Sedimentisphaerales bacterium]